MKEKKLTEKQKLFCLEFLVDLNATQAAIRAGYSIKTSEQMGYQLLQKTSVKKEIQELKKGRNERIKIDADYVLNQAVKLHERCMQEVKPKIVAGSPIKDENNNTVYEFNASGAAKSLELIGKHVNVSAFKDKIDIEANINQVTIFEIPNNGRDKDK